MSENFNNVPQIDADVKAVNFICEDFTNLVKAKLAAAKVYLDAGCTVLQLRPLSKKPFW
jgi:hypothetical protein